MEVSLLSFVILVKKKPKSFQSGSQVKIVQAGELSEVEGTVVTWGFIKDIPKATRILNHPEQVERALNKRYMSQCLRINRIPLTLSEEELPEWSKLYVVDVFDLIIWRVRELYYGERESHDLFYWNKEAGYLNQTGEPNSELERVGRLAQRTIYSLGLDFGQVVIIRDQDNHLVVHNVRPYPHLGRSGFQVLSEVLEVLEERREINGKLFLGADPEFMLREAKTKKMLPASFFFARQGIVGCDNYVIRHNGPYYPLAELRPLPAVEPKELVEGIKEIMKRALMLVPYRNVQWLAGSMPFAGLAIGGHVHFSPIWPSTELLHVLDTYLAIPMMLLENSKTAQARRRRYGFLGDFRWKSHGGFEYRALSSWLISPNIAEAILALARVVVLEYHNLLQRPLLSLRFQHSFYVHEKEAFLPLLPSLRADLSSTKTYQYYADKLDYLFSMLEEGKRWNEQRDIRQAWGLSIPQKQYHIF